MTGPLAVLPLRPWRGRLLALAGVVLVAFSLRSSVGVLSPILSDVRQDMDVPVWVVGIIGTLPPLCFAVFGLLTPMWERRVGAEVLASAAMLVVTVAIVLRACASDGAWLVGWTVVIFAGVGVGNVVLPPLIKRYFPDRPGQLTAVYSTMLAVSAVIPPLVTVPIASASDWRVSLGLWAVFALIAAVPWLLVVRRAPRGGSDDEPAPSMLARMPRLPTAWALMAGMAISAGVAYTGFAWLPQLVSELTGASAQLAAALLSLFALVGLPMSLFIPQLAARRPQTSGALYLIAAAAGVAGVVGLLVAPVFAGAVVWIVLLGVPQLLFPLTMVLIQARVRTHEASVALSGFVQSAGYAVAAVFPFLVGVLHEATGGWTWSLVLIGALIASAARAATVIARGSTVEREWERRHGSW